MLANNYYGRNGDFGCRISDNSRLIKAPNKSKLDNRLSLVLQHTGIADNARFRIADE